MHDLWTLKEDKYEGSLSKVSRTNQSVEEEVQEMTQKKWCSKCKKRTLHKIAKVEQAEVIDFENPLTVTSQEVARGKWITYECEKCGTQRLEGFV